MNEIEFVKSIFEPFHIEIVEINDDDLILKVGNRLYSIIIKEINEYLIRSEQIVIDPETAIYYPGHYEHYIQVADLFSSRFLMGGANENFRIVSPDSMISLEISNPSSNYLFSVFQNAKPELRRFLARPALNHDKEEIQPWNEIFRSFRTVKVTAEKETKYFSDKNKLKQIAEAGLFHFAFGNSVCFNLASKFERDHYSMGQRRRQEVQFPRRIYTSDLLSYYNLALSSDSLLLGYIALYKILEYFFPIAAEKVLHKQMADKIALPVFTHTSPKQLRELTNIIRKFDQRMDEQKMLSTVIEYNFNSNELIDWVNEYEKIEGKYYTIPQKVLGESFTLDINPDKISSSLAKRIYHTRNVLVHNKEDEPYRFIPFTGQEEILTREIPIVLFLAEQLIIKDGKDL